MNIQVAKKERIGWIDCAKGIAILLVIFGHSIGGGSRAEAVLRGVIFSFHMPLFFILSSLTFRPSVDGNDFLKKTEKAFKHLIIPALILYVIRILLEVLAIIKKGNSDELTINMWGGY